MTDGSLINTTEDKNRALAEAFYEKELLPKLLATAKGKILVLDIESGDYEVDADLLAASDRLQARRPGAFEYAFRVGYPAVGKLRGYLKRKV